MVERISRLNCLSLIKFFFHHRTFSLGNGVEGHYNTTAFYQFAGETFLSSLDSGL